jgi:hypothetical protein
VERRWTGSGEGRGLTLAVLFLFLLGGIPADVLACGGQPGRGPFTIRGTVRDEAGNPVAGLRLLWLPALPGTAQPDLENLYYAVQGRADHEVRTDAQGRFLMTEVRDYFAVPSHQYLLWGADVLGRPAAMPYWRVTENRVSLDRTPPGELEYELTARPAGALRVRLAGPDGQPFEGILPLAFGRAEEAGAQEEFALNAQFTRGEYLQGGLEPGITWVRVLKGERVEEIKLRNYLTQAGNQSPDLPPLMVAPGDVAVQAKAAVSAGQTGEVTLRLP